MTGDAFIALEGIRKTYPDGTTAVHELDLAVGPGEFFSLLGPSGCGKTTTLRMLAGFEEPTAGMVSIAGRDVTYVPPNRRDTGMVFQNYALFPHRTVRQNVAFGLRMRRRPKSEIAERVAESLAMVELEALGDRYPAQLSGGQQQRVALARAIVIRPQVLLCDEPFGALDKKLRRSMQFELKELQRRIGITMVYVTHDQEEALTMSDRIAVLKDGRLEQLDTPQMLYRSPRTRFVADFIGESNILSGHRDDSTAGPALVTEGGLRVPLPSTVDRLPGPIHVAVRPECVRRVPADTAAVGHGRVEETNFLGSATLVKLRLADGATILMRDAATAPPLGEELAFGWAAEETVVLADHNSHADTA